jgi:hypothetical protein
MNATALGEPTDDSSDNEETNADDTLPMTWDAASVESLIDKLQQDMDVYMWWAENFWPRVVGQEKRKLDVTSGNKKPSDLVTISDEALALLLFENHFLSWKAKAKSEDNARSQTSSITSSDVSTCMTKYTRNNGSTKDGWSDDGITHFQELMTKVREDRASTYGAEFDKLVQEKMQQEASAARGRRKRCRGMEGNKITMVENELPNIPDSDDE